MMVTCTCHSRRHATPEEIREEAYKTGYSKCFPPGIYISPGESGRIAERLPKTLVKYRLARGLTQEETAALLGISRQAYSNYETGARIPRMNFWIQIAGIFNVTVDELLQSAKSET